MLTLHSYRTFFLSSFFVLYNNNELNSDNRSKISLHLLHKYHRRFSKICKTSARLNQFLVLLYDCMPILKKLLSIKMFLKNANISQFQTTNPEKFDTANAIRKAKIAKQAHAFKNYARTYNFEILNSFYPELQLKYTESATEKTIKFVE